MYLISRKFQGLNITRVEFSWFKASMKIYYPQKFWSLKILTSLKQNSRSRGNTHGVQESTSMHLQARECPQSICHGSGKEWDSKKPFAMESFTCLYSISEESNCIHCRVTGQQRYLVALRQGSVRVELQYSVIVFLWIQFFVVL